MNVDATFIALYVAYSLTLMHYLNKVARIALQTFKPAIGVQHGEYELLGYKLTTMPARPVLILSLLPPVLSLYLAIFYPATVGVSWNYPLTAIN